MASGTPTEERSLSSTATFTSFDVTMQEHPTVHIRLSGQDW